MAVSAYGVINRIMMFAIMPGMVIGQGLQPILGFNYGAKRYDRALRVIKIALVSSTALCTIVFLVLYFSPELFIRIFTSEGSLITMASVAAKRIFLAIFMIGFMMVGSLVFQSIGKATQSFVTAISRSIVFLLPLIFILPNYWQLDGVWYAFPIADGLSVILTMILFIPQVKELRKLDKASRKSV